MEKFKDIIKNNNMSTRPEYYSGRGATTSDLNSEILFGLHKDIEKEYGKTAADSFVKMVAGLEVASATTFLNELYRLFNNEWKFVENHRQDKKGVTVPKNEDGEYDNHSAVMGIVGVFNAIHQEHNDTSYVVGGFLCANGVKPKNKNNVTNMWGEY